MTKEEKIQEILKTPIIASTTFFEEPCLVKSDNGNQYIISGQKYCRYSDEDMCDFTIGFYKEIYGKEILNDTKLADYDFAGDTMIDYYKKDLKNYHCLANFWILPSPIGRSCGKLNRSRLHVDLFIDKLLSNYDDYKNAYPNYFNNEFTLENFAKKHFLNGNFISEDGNTATKISNETIASNCISKRAMLIAYEKTDELYNYFHELKLI